MKLTALLLLTVLVVACFGTFIPQAQAQHFLLADGWSASGNLIAYRDIVERDYARTGEFCMGFFERSAAIKQIFINNIYIDETTSCSMYVKGGLYVGYDFSMRVQYNDTSVSTQNFVGSETTWKQLQFTNFSFGKFLHNIEIVCNMVSGFAYVDDVSLRVGETEYILNGDFEHEQSIADNQINNPSFELCTGYYPFYPRMFLWYNNVAVMDNTIARTGTYSVRTSYNAYAWQEITPNVAVNDIDEFYVWAYPSSERAAEYYRVHISLVNGTVISVPPCSIGSWGKIDLKAALISAGCTTEKIWQVKFQTLDPMWFEPTWTDDFYLTFSPSPSPSPTPTFVPSLAKNVLYFRSDTHVVPSENGELGYKLANTNSLRETFVSKMLSENMTSAMIGLRAWSYNKLQISTEITNGVPVCVQTVSSNTYGFIELVAQWDCPKQHELIDHLEMRIYSSFDSGESWNIEAIFNTASGEDDIANYILLPASTWEMHYFVYFESESLFEFGFGHADDLNMRIHLDYRRADPWRVAEARLSNQDFFGMVTVPWTWYLGNMFWTVLLLGGMTIIYVKHGSFKMVILLCWILGGSGSILWAMVPASGMPAAALMLAFAMAGTLYKLFHK